MAHEIPRPRPQHVDEELVTLLFTALEGALCGSESRRRVDRLLRSLNARQRLALQWLIARYAATLYLDLGEGRLDGAVEEILRAAVGRSLRPSGHRRRAG